MKKIILVNIIVFTFLLTAVEIGFRVAYNDPLIYGKTQPGQFSKYHPYLAMTNEANLDTQGLWNSQYGSKVPYHVKSNNLGFRMDFDISTVTNYQKGENEKVVLIFGGSAAYGFGNTTNETTAAGYLQKLLNEGSSKYKYTVFNMGNGWWISYQQLSALILYGLNLKPDWIIYMDGRNDIFHMASVLGEDVGIHGVAREVRHLVDGHMYRKNKYDFFRGWFENELIRFSATYRYLTKKEYIPRRQGIIYKPRGWKDIDQYIDFYVRIQNQTLLQCPTCKYILSLQPINRGTRSPMTSAERDKLVADHPDFSIKGGFVGVDPFFEEIIHYSYGKMRDDVSQLCLEFGDRCHFKVMTEVFPHEHEERVRFFVDDVHMNDDGNQKIAKYYSSVILGDDQS